MKVIVTYFTIGQSGAAVHKKHTKEFNSVVEAEQWVNSFDCEMVKVEGDWERVCVPAFNAIKVIENTYLEKVKDVLTSNGWVLECEKIPYNLSGKFGDKYVKGDKIMYLNFHSVGGFNIE